MFGRAVERSRIAMRFIAGPRLGVGKFEFDHFELKSNEHADGDSEINLTII